MSAKTKKSVKKGPRREQKKAPVPSHADFVARVKTYCDSFPSKYRSTIHDCRDAGVVLVTDNRSGVDLYFDTQVFRLKNPEFQEEAVDQSALLPRKLGLINLRFWAPLPDRNQVVDECLVTLDGKRPSETVWSKKLVGT